MSLPCGHRRCRQPATWRIHADNSQPDDPSRRIYLRRTWHTVTCQDHLAAEVERATRIGQPTAEPLEPQPAPGDADGPDTLPLDVA